MLPSPLAALAYGAIKVVGYAYFARRLNGYLGESVSPVKFGIAKTAIGLAGGLLYLFCMLPAMEVAGASNLIVFLGAAPVRVVAWCVALAVFYGARNRVWVLLTAALIGTTWTFALDGVMWLVYKVLPGMVMPFC
jgi:hypothetical protein